MDLYNAKWITAPCYKSVNTDNIDDVHRSIYLRKEFKVSAGVSEAKLLVCALGLGVIYINGENVTEDVLTTPYTAYDRRVVFNEYDVTNLLTEGDNCILAHVGNGFYNDNMISWKDRTAPWRDFPKMLCSLHVIYENGQEEYIESDKSFKATEGPAIFNHMRQGEVYDARIEYRESFKVGYCDNWENAIRANPPGGVYDMTDAPPIRVCEEYKPISLKNGIYDFGVNISGWAKIRVKGEVGTKITLAYDERLSDDGCHLYSAWKFDQLSEEDKPGWRGSNGLVLIEGLDNPHVDTYILKGEGVEEWAPSFCYHGFRYVKVDGAPEEFEITAQFIHNDFETVGSFVSSDETLNKIHEMSIRATLSNNVGIPTDCPHREQNGWAGDAVLAAGQSIMNFDMTEYYIGWLKNYKELQRPSGQIPAILPSPSWGYNWGSSSVGDSAMIYIPYWIYLNTGRSDVFELFWDNIVLLLGYLEGLADGDILDYGLSPDWSCSNLLVPCPIPVVSTASLYDNYVVMAKMARVLGKDATIWEEKAEKFKNGWRREYAGDVSLRESQTFLTIALYYDLLCEDEKNEYAKKLAELIKEQGYLFNFGVSACFYVFKGLSENGYADVIYKAITNPEYPSYAHWIKCGLTTLAEDWDMSQSQNHHMFSEVDNWFYKYLGGINYTDEGLVIKPIKLSDVDYVKATHKGICVEVNKDKVFVKLPCRARVVIGDTNDIFDEGEYTFSF